LTAQHALFTQSESFLMGGRQKHPALLVDRRRSRTKALRILEQPARSAAECPEGLHPKAEKAWLVLWTSSLSGAFKETDILGIERYFWYYSEWCTATAGPRDHRYVFKLERAMRELEREYGLGAFSRVRLGLTLVDEVKAVQALKQPAAPSEFNG
jgi:hypothetical protein